MLDEELLPIPVFEIDSPDEEDAKFLKESAYYESLVHSPGWKKAVQHMNELVKEAEDSMKAYAFDNPTNAMRLHMRWQQRGYMRDTLISHIEAVIQQRKAILERKRDEHSSNDTIN